MPEHRPLVSYLKRLTRTLFHAAAGMHLGGVVSRGRGPGVPPAGVDCGRWAAADRGVARRQGCSRARPPALAAGARRGGQAGARAAISPILQPRQRQRRLGLAAGGRPCAGECRLQEATCWRGCAVAHLHWSFAYASSAPASTCSHLRLQGCRGFAPSYTEGQQQELQRVLAAVRFMFEEAFEPIVDYATGAAAAMTAGHLLVICAGGHPSCASLGLGKRQFEPR